MHCAVPWGSVGQTVHDAPHAVASPSSAQPAPHRCVPVTHWKPHDDPSQVACVAPAGTGQGWQEVPQALGSVSAGHRPPQACWVGEHFPVQAAAASMHAPRHSCMLAGQAPPHDVPSQVAVPFAGAWQGVHEAPQVWTSSLATHPPGHRCCPAAHDGIG